MEPRVIIYQCPPKLTYFQIISPEICIIFSLIYYCSIRVVTLVQTQKNVDSQCDSYMIPIALSM